MHIRIQVAADLTVNNVFLLFFVDHHIIIVQTKQNRSEKKTNSTNDVGQENENFMVIFSQMKNKTRKKNTKTNHIVR